MPLELAQVLQHPVLRVRLQLLLVQASPPLRFRNMGRISVTLTVPWHTTTTQHVAHARRLKAVAH
jgi:hypothetical protein